MKRLITWTVLGCLFALSAPVFASRAYVGINLILRAGPDVGYPRVAILPAGAYIDIHGCLSDYTWCDVGYDGYRGWVAATYLQYYWDDHWVYLPSYGLRIGVPIVTFMLGSYWNNHYRHTHWYRDRSRWQQAPPRHVRPPRRPQGFRPRIPPPTHPPRSSSRSPAARQPRATRPSGTTRRATTRQQPRQRKQPRQGDKRGGGN